MVMKSCFISLVTAILGQHCNKLIQIWILQLRVVKINQIQYFFNILVNI